MLGLDDKNDFLEFIKFNDLKNISKSLKLKSKLKIEISDDFVTFNVDGAFFKYERVIKETSHIDPLHQGEIENAVEKVTFTVNNDMYFHMKNAAKMIPTSCPRYFVNCMHFTVNKELQAQAEHTDTHFYFQKKLYDFSYSGENEKINFFVKKENLPALLSLYERHLKNFGFKVNVLITEGRTFWIFYNDFLDFEHNKSILMPKLDLESSFDSSTTFKTNPACFLRADFKKRIFKMKTENTLIAEKNNFSFWKKVGWRGVEMRKVKDYEIPSFFIVENPLTETETIFKFDLTFGDVDALDYFLSDMQNENDPNGECYFYALGDNARLKKRIFYNNSFLSLIREILGYTPLNDFIYFEIDKNGCLVLNLERMNYFIKKRTLKGEKRSYDFEWGSNIYGNGHDSPVEMDFKNGGSNLYADDVSENFILKFWHFKTFFENIKNPYDFSKKKEVGNGIEFSH